MVKTIVQFVFASCKDCYASSNIAIYDRNSTLLQENTVELSVLFYLMLAICWSHCNKTLHPKTRQCDFRCPTHVIELALTKIDCRC